MPRSRRPSFLTRQKEQQRRAKAAAKRDARQARRKARSSETENPAADGTNGIDTSDVLDPEQESQAETPDDESSG